MQDQKKDNTESRRLMDRARKSAPGGLHSWARKYEKDIVWDRASGSKIYDVDGNEYIDLACGWGPIILGHCDEELNSAVSDALESNSVYAAGTNELEIEASETIKENVPSAGKVLFGMSGTEATSNAIRLARGYTGRRKIIKFQGMYNGWADSLAMNHLSDPDSLDSHDPFTEGILPEIIDETIILPYNDVDALEAAIEQHEDEIAGLIMEPVAHNMGCVIPEDGYLEAVRERTEEHGILLIFDEVITGFRHDLGGVQKLEEVTPDLTTMAKAVANGYPASVLCGKSEYMDYFGTNEDGGVMFGGTYNGHPVSSAAVVETVRLLEERNVHDHTYEMVDEITGALQDIIADIGITATVKRYGGVWLTYFMEPPIRNYEDVLRNDVDKYKQFRRKLIDQGVFVTTKNARRHYITDSHTQDDVDTIIEASENALREVQKTS